MLSRSKTKENANNTFLASITLAMKEKKSEFK